MDHNEAKRRIREFIEQKKESFMELSDRVWANPETRFEEFKASQWLSDVLAEAGFQVSKNLGGIETAFLATKKFGTGKPNIAYLSEYDALPEIGHACGHNIIGVASLAAGIALSQVLEQSGRDGTVSVFGCPGEEGGGGKPLLAKAGVFQGIDAAMMVHPGERNTSGAATNASARMCLKFFGKAAHAAGAPHKGINALDAVIQTFNMINGLRQMQPEDVRLMGIITNGGQSFNIIPEYAECWISVRAARLDVQAVALEQVRECARAAAKATRARLEIDQPAHYPHFPVRPNPTLNRLFEANLEYLGADVAKNVPPNRGSTDFGNVSWIAPGLHGGVAIVPVGTGGHTVELRDAAGSGPGHKGLILSANALAMTGVDLFWDPDQLRQAWTDFEALAER
jgi:amidohydrolase